MSRDGCQMTNETEELAATQENSHRTSQLPFRIIVAIFLGAGFIIAGFNKESIVLSFSGSSDVGLLVGGTSLNSDFRDSKAPNKNDDIEETRIPQRLIELGVYRDSDFINEAQVSPPFWNPSKSSWGPCFPETHAADIPWTDDRNSTSYLYRYDPKERSFPRQKSANNADSGVVAAGGCRPGFLIIGAGKCGTSSLYHYLNGHPRVAPAYSKQIHYFIYHLDKPMSWYYGWFPSAQSYLEHGTLLTGEASPGYLPYPKAVRAVNQRLPGNPKIVMVGRNPLTRMYSSYRYNYVVPTLEYYKAGRRRSILGHRDDEYYEQFMFSFEELVRAELNRLRACFDDFGPQATRDLWYQHKWTQPEFDRRQAGGLDPLFDLDEVCYGNKVNITVTRPQWAELQMAKPRNYIPPKKAFLIQSFIGRSLYVFPLEWWYIAFDPNDILFFCTEDLSNPTKLNELSLQMGLPSYNYTDVVNEGAYNVGGHQGYDTATSWDLVKQEQEQESNHSQVSPSVSSEEENANDGIPLSDELRQEVLDFIRPYNERLFQLVGKRCDW